MSRKKKPPCVCCGTERKARSACPLCGKVICRDCAESPYAFCCDGAEVPDEDGALGHVAEE